MVPGWPHLRLCLVTSDVHQWHYVTTVQIQCQGLPQAHLPVAHDPASVLAGTFVNDSVTIAVDTGQGVPTRFTMGSQTTERSALKSAPKRGIYRLFHQA